MDARGWLERRAGGPVAFYDGVMAPLERRLLAGPRRRLTGGLTGAVLEVGCGTGATFAGYPAAARVRALEPSEPFRAAARRAAAAAEADIEVLAGDVAALPFPEATFDAVVGALVWCSLADPAAALREVARVLRPGGELRLLEHVRHPRLGVLQDTVDPLWTAIEGRGCRLGRDTPAAVARAGFTDLRVTPVPLPPGASWLFPLVEVRARPPRGPARSATTSG